VSVAGRVERLRAGLETRRPRVPPRRRPVMRWLRSPSGGPPVRRGASPSPFKQGLADGRGEGFEEGYRIGYRIGYAAGGAGRD